VSLRILFADDSMTAQNMGKKILSEAGYDVVAVSNGAAAVKKIAEQKPDIIILDVYMPGYSGLEVCEKVRGSLDTLKTPVLLTVGKMEPYKPEDANRVKADGVIIKPFEASDLLAIIKKFEERIGSAPPPPLAKPAAVVERYEEEAMSPAEMPVEQHSGANRASMQPMVEVPDHMASSAAFGDMLGSEPASPAGHFAVNTPSAAFETSVIVPAPPVPVSEYEIAIPARQEAPAPVQEPVQEDVGPVTATPVQPSPEALAPEIDAAPEVVVTPVEAAPEAVPEQPTPEAAAVTPEPAPEAPHPHFIPVFQEPEAPAAEYSFIPTAAPPVSDVEIQREPALQETAEETTRSTRADLVEPGLISTMAEEIRPFPAQPVQDSMAAAPQEFSPSTAEVGYSASLPTADAAPEVTDADFEARVAAAMAAYNHASEVEMPATPVAEPQAAVEHAGSLAATGIHEIHAEEPVETALDAPAPSFEYHPPVRVEAPVMEEIVPEPAAAPEITSAHAAATAGMEAAIPEAAAAAAAESGADHHTIAQAIHRVMERLKPELVEEIMKELKSKK
jgi:CheY-like chemotaxis protein